MASAHRIDPSRTVLVTGARGTLGDCVVQRFLADGARVIAVDFAKPSQAKLVPDPSLKGVERLDLDLADPASVEQAAAVIERHGLSVEVLIHCAGGFRWSHVDSMPLSDWEFLLDANLRSTFNLLRAFLPPMKARGYGRMVFVGANAALSPSAGMGPYCASKAGLHALVQAAAAEVKDKDVTINAVLPSIIDTPANRRDMPDADTSRWVSRESLAEIIFSLTRPWGDPVRGALIPVTGRM